MTTILHLNLQTPQGNRPESFTVNRLYNLGFTIRDADLMRAHLDEIVKEGVPMPHVDKPPIILPISDWAITTADEITVQRERTSGEIEIVTLVKPDGSLLVGVGSDHTDRSLEAVDIPWSKQVCPNVLAPSVWPLEQVEDHWDEIYLESEVGVNGEFQLYQRAPVNFFWTPREMVESLVGRIKPVQGGMVLFSGTVVTVDHTLSYSRDWVIRLVDPVLGLRLEHQYRVTVLSEEII